MKTGFMGLGAMGRPMAGHLHRAGMLAVVGNRTAAVATQLAAELDVRAAASIADFAGCDAVMLCVPGARHAQDCSHASIIVAHIVTPSRTDYCLIRPRILPLSSRGTHSGCLFAIPCARPGPYFAPASAVFTRSCFTRHRRSVSETW